MTIPTNTSAPELDALVPDLATALDAFTNAPEKEGSLGNVMAEVTDSLQRTLNDIGTEEAAALKEISDGMQDLKEVDAAAVEGARVDSVRDSLKHLDDLK